MPKKIVVIIYGESGSGKTSIKNEIVRLRPELHDIITCTSRPMREGEVDGETYHFHSKDELIEKIYNGEMLESAVFNDWIYGTTRDALIEDGVNIGVYNPEGVENLNDEPSLECINFYIYTSPKTRLLRSLTREDNPDVDEIIRRYGTDKKDFQYIDVPHFIKVTNDGDVTVTAVAQVIIKYIDMILDRLQ